MCKSTVILRAFAVWLVIMGTETLHGIARAVFLVPLVGDFPSRQIGVFTGSVLILIVSFLLIGWVGEKRTGPLVLVGLFWLALTALFEVGLGRFAFGYSWQRIASDYDITRGGLMPVGLLVLVFSPLIGSRVRGLVSRRRDRGRGLE
jgi:hypothetical protein